MVNSDLSGINELLIHLFERYFCNSSSFIKSNIVLFLSVEFSNFEIKCFILSRIFLSESFFADHSS